MVVEYTGVYWEFEREAAVGGYREGAQREGGATGRGGWRGR